MANMDFRHGYARPPFPGYFKLVYVTSDLAGSAKSFFGAFGIDEFETRTAISLPTPDGGSASVDMTSAWAGALQIDLVQQRTDPAGYFSDADRRPKLHSLGRLFESDGEAEAMAARYEAMGLTVSPLAQSDAGRLFSVDVQSKLGHRIEGIVLSPAERQRLERLPGLAAQPAFDRGQPPFPGFYQFTYITNDFERAKALVCDLHGIESFMEMTPLEVTLKDNQPARMNAALAYVGAMEIEVMNPVDGAVQIYTDMMPEDGFVIRHHHISRLFTDYDAFEQRGREFTAMGHPPIADNVPGKRDQSRFYYIDCRDETGHYLESSVFDAPTREWIDTFPRH